MAESTKEAAARRPKPKAGAGTPATAKKETAKSTPLDKAIQEATTSTPETKSRFGFFRSLGGRKGGAESAGASADAGKPKRPANPSMGRFFLGMSLYMVMALAAQFALSFIMPASTRKQVLFTLPLLGPVTTYLLVWMLTLIAILYALYKFKILPRTLGQPRPRAATAKVDPRASKAAPTTKVAHGPVEGPSDDAYGRVKARIRAERRKERRH